MLDSLERDYHRNLATPTATTITFVGTREAELERRPEAELTRAHLHHFPGCIYSHPVQRHRQPLYSSPSLPADGPHALPDTAYAAVYEGVGRRKRVPQNGIPPDAPVRGEGLRLRPRSAVVSMARARIAESPPLASRVCVSQHSQRVAGAGPEAAPTEPSNA